MDEAAGTLVENAFWVHKTPEGDKFRLIPSGLDNGELERIGFSPEDFNKYQEFCEDTEAHLSNVPVMQGTH